MSPAPALPPIGERLRERTAPLAPDDERFGWAHAILCGALGKALEQVAEVFDPPDPIPPAAPLLDVNLCPDWALPWLAQVVGVTLPAGATADQQRELIRSIAGWKRGTRAAIMAAAQVYLTGEQVVYLRERLDGDPYRLAVVTLAAETPDPALTRAAVLAQKPGGIVLAVDVSDGQTYLTVRAGFVSYGALKAAYPDYGAVLVSLPA